MRYLKVLIGLIGIVLFSGNALASDMAFTNDRALKDVSSASVYFDLSVEDVKKMLLRLSLVEQTLAQLEDAGVAVQSVVGIRGGASRFITQQDYYVLEDEVQDKLKIQERIKGLSERGVIVEQCSIAAELHGISFEDFIPGVTIVENGYVSLVGYQSKGYAVVPMD